MINVQIMDAADQEKYRAITKLYYNRADCILMVYDISDRHSFEECNNFFKNSIKEKCKENIKVILLGNKTDLEDERKVPSEEAADFALENNYIFMETSCLRNQNVTDAFETLIEITNIELKKNNNKINSLKLDTNEKNKKKNVQKSETKKNINNTNNEINNKSTNKTGN